jgi:hypothetical protein
MKLAIQLECTSTHKSETLFRENRDLCNACKEVCKMLEDAPRVWESAPGVHKEEQIVHCCLLQKHVLAAE